MKKIIVALMSFMLLFGSVSYANGLAKQDAELLFGNNVKASQVMAIGKSEMSKTEGKYGWWGALAGAASGAYGYIGYSMSSHDFSWRGFGASVAGGAAAGVFLPTPTAIGFARNAHAAMFGGFIRGWF